MAAPAILRIDIIADASKAAGALKQTGSAAQSTGSKFSALGKAVAGGAAVGAVIAFGTSAVKAATESQVATRRLEQVFRSMGDTTGVAAKAAEDYAGALSRKIGVDDESIMAAQAQLATFGAVSDATARSAGIFDRATAAAADLAAAGFGSLSSNSVQLGKALQDPVKGITALAKSGVTFTAAQKAQIAALVKSGKVLEAQKIVLGAVEQQVGGTAAATATSADKMNVAWGETQEKVGNALLPVLEKLLPILSKLADFIGNNISWILPLAAAIGVLAIAWNIASIAATLFGTTMLAALWPVLLVIAAIAAVVAIGVLLVKNWDTIKAAAATVWAALVTAWNAVLGVLKAVWQWVAANWPLLLAILAGPIGVAVLLVVRNFQTIKNAVLAVIGWIRANWPLLLAILTGPIGGAVLIIVKNWDRIKAAASALYDWVAGKLRAIADAFRGVADTIGGLASGIADAIKGPLNAVIRAWNGLQFKVPEVNVGPIHFGGQTLGVPNIPELATGGMVMRTGLAVVHAGETFSGVGGSGVGGNVTVNITVNAGPLGADAPQVQRAVVQALRGYSARNGPLPVAVTGRR
jgi:hypothetical protein